MEDKLSLALELQDVTVQTELLPSRFSKVAIIGQGGMGLVFHAVDLTLQRDVAVKLLHFEGSRSEEVHERFLREAKALASLDHVNIVKILASGITDDGNPYHVLEFLEGEPLSAVLSKLSTLPISRFFTIFEQVCQGLIHAHEKNIVHRDLKPSNIFLLKDLNDRELVKVIDFGIARLLVPDQNTDSLSLTRTNLLLGSPAYMSPEQCNGSKVDHRSDIYSLGCVMYECLTGAPLFTAGSGMELMYKHMREEPPQLETPTQTESQRQLARLIERCLRKSPEERPESINAIAAELKEISASDSNIKEFAPARRENRFWTNKMIIRLLVLPAAFLFACIFANNSLQQTQKLDSDQRFTYKPPAKDLSKVKALKSSFVALKKTLDSKPTDAVRKETLDSMVDKAIEYSQLKTWSHQDGIDLLNIASNYCDEKNDHDLLLKAKLIEQRAIAESFQNQDTFESSFEEAIKLIRQATKSQSSDEEVDARKNIIMHYLSKVDSSSPENFSKA
ncbi:MAG: serine/threonine protein kinase, partial [Candidatus Obscuribacterales bacterium]|nr:serine/threonine protein kinase [Candidatus Obscuribacterales bacterium]